ncbi:MAG TPA: cupin domain-containing protein [Firmicutes bacterium]|nr:cupin domain-containing protein [Bacillota bacterium]
MTGPHENLKGHVFEVSGLLEYQEEAVVSRTLVDRSAGTVTLFAFDAGQGLSEHTAPYDALVHVLQGELLVTVSGQPHSVSAGQAIIMPAREPHALKAQARSKMLLVMIRS